MLFVEAIQVCCAMFVALSRVGEMALTSDMVAILMPDRLVIDRAGLHVVTFCGGACRGLKV